MPGRVGLGQRRTQASGKDQDEAPVKYAPAALHGLRYYRLGPVQNLRARSPRGRRDARIKTNQPLRFASKWLAMNERETRFELATLSLGS